MTAPGRTGITAQMLAGQITGTASEANTADAGAAQKLAQFSPWAAAP
jgi:hypothetical protein